VPTANDYAYVADGGTASVTQSGATCFRLLLGSVSGNGYVQMTAGSLAVPYINGQSQSGNEIVGYSGSGAFIQSGGTNNVDTLTLGMNAGSSGTYVLSDSGYLYSPSENIGQSGTASFTQTGGTNNSQNVILGLAGNSVGTYALGGAGYMLGGLTLGNMGTGIFTQSGGTYNASGIVLGGYTGGSGSYNLSGNSYLSSASERISYYLGSTGSFTQSGGTNNVSGALSVGVQGSGTYSLSGNLCQSGTLSINVGGKFTQSGGSNIINGPLYVGYSSGGSYNLSGNSYLSCAEEDVAFTGTGTGSFTQTGGTNNISGYLYFGESTVSGSFSLSGNGQVMATGEVLGVYGSGTFTQSGGTNSASLLQVGQVSTGGRGRYVLGGGSLQVDGLMNQGTFSGGAASAGMTASIVDLSSGTWQNLGNISLSMGTSSLLIVPVGFNPSASGFASLSALGITHTIGTTLTVAAGQSVVGVGSIADFVACQGTIRASSAAGLNLNGGLALYDGGTVWLGTGNLYGNSSSTVSGGSLAVNFEEIGQAGTGSLTQTGGTNSVSILTLGYYFNGPVSAGTYNLSGSGNLTVNGNEQLYDTGVFNQSGGTQTVAGGLQTSGTYNLSGGYLAVSGTEALGSGFIPAFFNQSGGTHSISSDCYIGIFAPDSEIGNYNLSGSGYLAVNGAEEIGYMSTGSFTQSGGTNSTRNLAVGTIDNRTRATYSLNGGLLITSSVSRGPNGAGSGGATFNFNGGTLQASGNNSNFVSGPMFVAVQVGGAIIDVQGFSDAIGLNLAHDPSLGSTRDGGLTKLGGGILTLSGNNTYTGPTKVLAGTLIVTNRFAIENGTSLTVGSATAFNSAPIVQDSILPPSTVPEPATLALLTAVAAVLVGCTRRRKSR
jgi:autotransporter-associated beta strand protein